MKVLITGFTPFGGEKINPSFEAVKRLDDTIGSVTIIKKEIPTVFKKSIQMLEKYIQEEKPDAVICVGQAGGRFEMSIERVAINLDDARIPDNEKNQPIDQPVFEDGENAYFSNLPLKAMAKKIQENHIPAVVSNTAGTFVCNHLMYGLMYLIHKKYTNIKGGFIHVPYIPDQILEKKGVPYMTLEEIIKALTCAIEALVENDTDIKITLGEIC
ncbi:pyroglutamyl-peptidase I [Marinisporobacter balticus]|uniref:Pyrrolidone-carboxylate peptidase n=1 Tax=Marinisporobacter balticus TaxID=2018667 RepID=A0A4R2KP99_9FIRM|nr:pyroglutamyl-peptidase I [Marinisporobacter balticus]TCO72676.1 pyroglutamyl-peptidase [Marinisporobacter balticus]